MNNRALFYPSLILLASVLATLCPNTSEAQDIRAVSEFESSGIVRHIASGQITIRHENGERVVYKIQDKDEDAISLDGDKAIFRMPAEIKVSGTLPGNLLERGMIVETQIALNRFGKTEGALNHFKVVAATPDQFKIEAQTQPEGGKFEPVDLLGRVVRVNERNVLIEVGESSRLAKRGRIQADLDPEATMDLEMDNLNRVKTGDTVNSVTGLELSNGVFVIRKIDISMTAPRKAATTSFHDQLEQRFSDVSDEPVAPRETRSDHFILYTDISDRQSNILLTKLETMYGLIGKYYGRRPTDPIECYVVRDLGQWNSSQLHPAGIAKIQEGAGVTLSASNGRQTKSIVYSCDNQDVVQHESVHAFCSMAFGTAGPVWYAEGMAEIGNYLRPGELGVNIDPVAIEYLTTAEPKKLADIVAAGQITGDSWQAYAWRWALCYLLSHNPNYERRFKKLGVNLMYEKDDSFDNAFGPIANEISFEYDQFIENFGNGYRVDLCTWDWETEASTISASGRSKKEVLAAAGWQATKLEVRKDESYDFVAQGTWKIVENGEEVTANGAEGEGKLLGVILYDYKLSEPFEMGEAGTFVAPEAGQLYLRCEDVWTELADNAGKITVHLRRTPK